MFNLNGLLFKIVIFCISNGYKKSISSSSNCLVAVSQWRAMQGVDINQSQVLSLGHLGGGMVRDGCTRMSPCGRRRRKRGRFKKQ